MSLLLTWTNGTRNLCLVMCLVVNGALIACKLTLHGSPVTSWPACNGVNKQADEALHLVTGYIDCFVDLIAFIVS